MELVKCTDDHQTPDDKQNGSKPKYLNMRLSENASANLQEFMNLTGETSQTRCISSALEIAVLILSTISTGGKIHVKEANGETSQIKFLGLR